MSASRTGVDRSRDRSQPVEKLHANEAIKARSDSLRGGLLDGLADPITGAISSDDQQIAKFHGIYLQDDRDLRDERRRKMLEPAWSFMVRARLPGGVCRPDQWLRLDELARTRANGTLRLTTRQSFQFHGVVKKDLKATIQAIHGSLLDTLGACGDVNRGVMASSLPELGPIHEQLFAVARAVSDQLVPRSRAYHEIWLDGEPVYQGPKQDAAGDAEPEEPIYGSTYLPRKFKIGFAVPPVNDVDVFTQDLGFIAIADGDRLVGFNVVVGGGMGRNYNEPDTYPRLGDVIGFCPAARAVSVAEHVVTIQRDYGDRVDRRLARMKYTIDRLGLDWFVAELLTRLGWTLEQPRPYRFETSQDRFGWSENRDGTRNYTLFVENGRVTDGDGHRTMTGLREIARVHAGDFRITPNQNFIVARIAPADSAAIESILEQHGITAATDRSDVRRHSMACVAMPTCPLAMAESERYFPHLVTKVEALLADTGLANEPIVMRMSGCNNGCSRPYVAEIGFSGRAPGRYDVYVGGGFHGQRLASPCLENVDETAILDTLRGFFDRYAAGKRPDERFGDFAIREGWVPEVREGRRFNG